MAGERPCARFPRSVDLSPSSVPSPPPLLLVWCRAGAIFLIEFTLEHMRSELSPKSCDIAREITLYVLNTTKPGHWPPATTHCVIFDRHVTRTDYGCVSTLDITSTPTHMRVLAEQMMTPTLCPRARAPSHKSALIVLRPTFLCYLSMLDQPEDSDGDVGR